LIGTGGKGTVYLGDGKMGISGLAVPTLEYITSPVQDERFASTGTEYHFFPVKTSTSDPRLNVTAIDNQARVFDSFLTGQ
jgi:hypothetical protein